MFQLLEGDLPLSYARVCASHAEVVLALGLVSSFTIKFQLLPDRLLVERKSRGRLYDVHLSDFSFMCPKGCVL